MKRITCPERFAKEKRQQKYIRDRIVFDPVFFVKGIN